MLYGSASSHPLRSAWHGSQGHTPSANSPAQRHLHDYMLCRSSPPGAGSAALASEEPELRTRVSISGWQGGATGQGQLGASGAGPEAPPVQGPAFQPPQQQQQLPLLLPPAPTPVPASVPVPAPALQLPPAAGGSSSGGSGSWWGGAAPPAPPRPHARNLCLGLDGGNGSQNLSRSAALEAVAAGPAESAGSERGAGRGAAECASPTASAADSLEGPGGARSRGGSLEARPTPDKADKAGTQRRAAFRVRRTAPALAPADAGGGCVAAGAATPLPPLPPLPPASLPPAVLSATREQAVAAWARCAVESGSPRAPDTQLHGGLPTRAPPPHNSPPHLAVACGGGAGGAGGCGPGGGPGSMGGGGAERRPLSLLELRVLGSGSRRAGSSVGGGSCASDATSGERGGCQGANEQDVWGAEGEELPETPTSRVSYANATTSPFAQAVYDRPCPFAAGYASTPGRGSGALPPTPSAPQPATPVVLPPRAGLTAAQLLAAACPLAGRPPLPPRQGGDGAAQLACSAPSTSSLLPGSARHGAAITTTCSSTSTSGGGPAGTPWHPTLAPSTPPPTPGAPAPAAAPAAAALAAALAAAAPLATEDSNAALDAAAGQAAVGCADGPGAALRASPPCTPTSRMSHAASSPFSNPVLDRPCPFRPSSTGSHLRCVLTASRARAARAHAHAGFARVERNTMVLLIAY